MSALISLQNASKTFGDVTAYRDVTVEVKRGEIIALVGPNGSGKTTLIRSLMGLTPFDNAAAQRVLGHQPPIGIAERKNIFYVPDDDSLIDNITALEYFGLVACAYGQPASQIEAAITALRRLDFDTGRLTATLKTYSHGMRKKIQLAAMHIPPVELIIIDEPTNGLDPTAIILLRQLVQEAAGPRKTILISTHNLPFAEELAERVLLMKNTMLYDGSLKGLFKKTKTSKLEAAYAQLVLHMYEDRQPSKTP